MLARFDVKGDTKAARLFYQNFKFVLLFFSKNAQCIANKFILYYFFSFSKLIHVTIEYGCHNFFSPKTHNVLQTNLHI